MKTVKLLILGTIVLLFSATGCIENFTIHGNGIEATEARITSDFKKVKSSGEYDVHITYGEEHEVVVKAESNLIPYIETNVSGSSLNIDVRGLHNLRNRLPMEVYITTPNLEGVKQSGSGEITTDYFYSDDFDIALSGSGNITVAVETEKIDASISGSGKIAVSGVAEDARFSISGSGNIDAYDLMLETCNAKISGSGDMWVSVENFLHATISGSGNIFYYGNPGVETHISGSGNVIHEN
jgi:hypothetical protein